MLKLDNRYIAAWVGLGVFASLIYWGLQSNWIQYKAECEHGTCMFHIGESFTSITTAIFYQVHGARYWYLQLLSLSPGEHGWSAALYQPDWVERRYMIYTHNPNIGGFVVYAAALLGAQTIVIPAIVTAAAYALGIYFAFRFAYAASSSQFVGAAFGLFMATDFFYNLSWGLNLIRGWTWLGVFVFWYSVVMLARGGSGRYVIGLIAGSLITFLIGLDISIVVTTSALALVIVAGASWRTRLRIAALIVVVSMCMLLLRQVQIIGALGVNVWMTDIIYTAGLKMPAELRWYELPDAATIEGWFYEHNLTRGYSSDFSVIKIVNRFFFLGLLQTWIPLWPLLPIFGLGLACLLVLVIIRRPVDNQALAVLGALVLGTAVSGSVLFPHFTGYFVKLGFPYVTALVFFALAIAVSSIWRVGRAIHPHLASFAVAGVVGVWIWMQVVNVQLAAPEPYPHLVRIVPYGFWFCPPMRPNPIACS